MAQFTDYYPDLKLPKEAIQQLADDTKNRKYDEYGVRQIELYHNDQGNVYCLLEAPNAEAERKHHEVLGIPCDEVHQVNTL